MPPEEILRLIWYSLEEKTLYLFIHSLDIINCCSVIYVLQKEDFGELTVNVTTSMHTNISTEDRGLKVRRAQTINEYYGMSEGELFSRAVLQKGITCLSFVYICRMLKGKIWLFCSKFLFGQFKSHT